MSVTAALVTVGALLLGGCTSAAEEIVTVTVTPGEDGQASQSAGQVTVPGADGATDGGTAPAEQSPASGTATPSSAARSLADAIRIISKPAFGAKDVGPKDPMTVTVFSGKITDLVVKGDDGSTVKGEISEDKQSFKLVEPMAYGVTYTFNGTATAVDNSTKPIEGKITTIKPAKTVNVLINLREGQTYGVGAPIVLTFTQSIQDRAAAERALKVTTDKGDIEGSWGWLQDEDFSGLGYVQSRVHFRPKVYWPANTKVTLHADLYGVNYGNGWGREDLTRNFTIGRSLIAKADVASMRLILIKDGQVIRNYPVSYGAESEPGKTTVSGVHIVQEKKREFKMSNPQFGYYNVPEKWAVRINNNGEFIHHNEAVEKAGLLGKKNVSHGCINMGEANAMEFYGWALFGDPVEVTGTKKKMGPADYIYDWAYTWDQWKTLSALGS